MWTKDGKTYTGGGIIAADGRWHSTPTREMFIAAGWTWLEPPAPEPEPKRYSKLKIIDALGEAWPEKQAELEAAGIYEKFTQATFLSTDYPAFAAIYNNLTDEERRILDEECLYDD